MGRQSRPASPSVEKRLPAICHRSNWCLTLPAGAGSLPPSRRSAVRVDAAGVAIVVVSFISLHRARLDSVPAPMPCPACHAGCDSLRCRGANPSTLSAPTQEIQGALASIDATAMLGHIRVLASDEFEGRAPGTRGEELTVEYLVNEFKRMGLKPGNPDGSFVQQVPFVATRRNGALSLNVGDRLIDLSEPDQCVVGSAWQVPDIDIQGSEIVFVGYGVVAPEYGWDDFKGTDLKGKTLLMLADDPQVPTSTTRRSSMQLCSRAVA